MNRSDANPPSWPVTPTPQVVERNGAHGEHESSGRGQGFFCRGQLPAAMHFRFQLRCADVAFILHCLSSMPTLEKLMPPHNWHHKTPLHHLNECEGCSLWPKWIKWDPGGAAQGALSAFLGHNPHVPLPLQSPMPCIALLCHRYQLCPHTKHLCLVPQVSS